MTKKRKKIDKKQESMDSSSKKTESKPRPPLPAFVNKRLTEGVFLGTVAVAIFLVLSLFTYDPLDSGWSRAGNYSSVENAGGTVGAWSADFLLFIFGYFAYLFPLLFVYFGWLWLRGSSEWSIDYRVFAVRFLGFILLLIGGCCLADLGYFSEWPLALPNAQGGVLGQVVAMGLITAFNFMGASLFALVLFLVGITLFAGLSWLQLIETTGRYTLQGVHRVSTASMGAVVWFANGMGKLWSQCKERLASRREVRAQQAKLTKPRRKPVLIQVPTSEPVTPSKRFEQDRQADLFHAAMGGIPPLSLLEAAEKDKKQNYSPAKLEEMSREVEQRLLDFGVEVQVVAVHPGPVITRFELQLAPGIKVSKISGLAKDLARALSVTSVRVVEVIPGKPVVGIELPNKHRQMVRLCEVLATEQYEQARSALTLAMGVDIAGHPVIVDLAKMPHLLVAGTTGSGKSVGINAMLLSLLFKSTPEEVRLIMIDPKMLELSVYEGIPHLLTPVVTDMNEAANALRWSVAEMERRYRLMAAMGVRNISGYNNKIKEANKEKTPIKDPLYDGPAEQAPDLETLPFIVVVIDELADMMMVVGKKVEQLIARIAQKARAAGIHLVLATQRPSVDVLTGLIKSNIPTRISFQVSSKIDSRTILDQQGAEQLLGHGDMLYLAPGTGAPVRIHGAFVDDNEVHRVAADWKKRAAPNYIEEILTGSEVAGENDFAFLGERSEDTEDSDPLYDEAVQFVVHSRKASISSVQRRLKIGYNRAARLIEEMERTGVVSTMETNGARRVLAPSSVE